MPISYSNLFQAKLGPIAYTLGLVNAHRGTTVPGRVATMVADFAGADARIAASLWSALSSYQGAGSSLPSALQSLFQQAIVQDVGAAVALPDAQLPTALAALVADMLANGQTVAANAVGATATANAGNTGNAAVLVGLKAKTGLALENALAETVAASCTSDAQSGGATAGQEVVRFQGQPAASGGPLNFTWPAGSGASLSVPCVSADAAKVGGTQNWLTNSNFETWTVANVPDGWTIAAGTAGTQVLKTTTAGTFYAGSAALSLVGDGSTLTALTQALAGVQPLTQYAVNLWVRVSTAPAAGVLEVALVDGSGAILQDAQGASNAVTAGLTTIGTTFVPVGGFFRTPRVLPAAVNLRLRLSTAQSAGSSCYADRLAFAQSTALYPGGPHLAAFSGNAPLIAGDGYSIAVTNNRAGQWQTAFDQLCGARQLGVLLPSTSGSPTIPNAWIA